MPAVAAGTAAGIAALIATTARARKAKMFWACILVKETGKGWLWRVSLNLGAGDFGAGRCGGECFGVF